MSGRDARACAHCRGALIRPKLGFWDDVGMRYGNGTVTVCVLPRVACMRGLLGGGLIRVWLYDLRPPFSVTTARLPIDTLRAQSPPNTGSTIQYSTDLGNTPMPANSSLSWRISALQCA